MNIHVHKLSNFFNTIYLFGVIKVVVHSMKLALRAAASRIYVCDKVLPHFIPG